MKKPETPRKLHLATERIRALNVEQLQAVVGGIEKGGFPTSGRPSCSSY